MPYRTPRFLLSKIKKLFSAGYNSVVIAKRLRLEDSYSITDRGIRKIIARLRSERQLPTHRTIKVKNEHYEFVNFLYRKNNELTASEVQDKILYVFGISLSIATVKVIRKKLGWTYKQASYCQLISVKNCSVRRHFALEMLRTREEFLDVIFTDETSIEMSTSGSFQFYKRSSSFASLPRKCPKPKHALKVHMWGGISYLGPTRCCVFTGIMDSISYQQILKSSLLPFANRKYPNGFRLYQDNDAKHTSRSTMQWLNDNRVKTMPAPASSPDLNPIENVWATLKDYLKRQVKPRTKAQLVDGITEFWTNLTAEDCAKYIDHIHRVLPHVVLNDGGPSGF